MDSHQHFYSVFQNSRGQKEREMPATTMPLESGFNSCARFKQNITKELGAVPIHPVMQVSVIYAAREESNTAAGRYHESPKCDTKPH